MTLFPTANLTDGEQGAKEKRETSLMYFPEEIDISNIDTAATE